MNTSTNKVINTINAIYACTSPDYLNVSNQTIKETIKLAKSINFNETDQETIEVAVPKLRFEYKGHKIELTPFMAYDSGDLNSGVNIICDGEDIGNKFAEYVETSPFEHHYFRHIYTEEFKVFAIILVDLYLDGKAME